MWGLSRLQEYLDVLELEETYRQWHPSAPHFRDGETEAQGGRGDTNKSSGGFKKDETPPGWGIREDSLEEEAFKMGFGMIGGSKNLTCGVSSVFGEGTLILGKKYLGTEKGS